MWRLPIFTHASRRRIGLLTFWLYVSVLSLAIGHRCGSEFTSGGHTHPDSARVLKTAHGTQGAPHTCPICAWQHNTASAVVALNSGFALECPGIGVFTPAEAFPLYGSPLTALSRGPPSA